jgi:hypothetical protein
MIERSSIHKRVPTSAKEGRRLRTALVLAQRRIRELHEEREAAELRRVLDVQARRLEVLAEEVEIVSRREQELRAMLLGAHDQLMRRAEEIRADLARELQPTLPGQHAVPQPYPNFEVPEAGQPADPNAALGPHTSPRQVGEYLDYPLLVGHIQEIAKAVLPQKATVAVVSKGDDELLKLGGERSGWHFPQNDDGVYAGYHPVDGFAAISHLEELRSRGADYLLFPATAFWWLERYEEFAQHLDASYRRLWGEGCIIYALHEPRPDAVEVR